jgi:hypothetical protein
MIGFTPVSLLFSACRPAKINAGSLEAVGLPGYPEVLFVEINLMKSWQSFVALYFS